MGGLKVFLLIFMSIFPILSICLIGTKLFDNLTDGEMLIYLFMVVLIILLYGIIGFLVFCTPV